MGSTRGSTGKQPQVSSSSQLDDAISDLDDSKSDFDNRFADWREKLVENLYPSQATQQVNSMIDTMEWSLNLLMESVGLNTTVGWTHPATCACGWHYQYASRATSISYYKTS